MSLENDLEERIRHRAHQIWLDEGKPEGQAERHWQAARHLVAVETENDATLVPLDRSLREPSEPLFTAEAHGDLPGALTDQGEDQQFPLPRPANPD